MKPVPCSTKLCQQCAAIHPVPMRMPFSRSVLQLRAILKNSSRIRLARWSYHPRSATRRYRRTAATPRLSQKPYYCPQKGDPPRLDHSLEFDEDSVNVLNRQIPLNLLME